MPQGPGPLHKLATERTGTPRSSERFKARLTYGFPDTMASGFSTAVVAPEPPSQYNLRTCRSIQVSFNKQTTARLLGLSIAAYTSARAKYLLPQTILTLKRITRYFTCDRSYTRNHLSSWSAYNPLCSGLCSFMLRQHRLRSAAVAPSPRHSEVYGS